MQINLYGSPKDRNEVSRLESANIAESWFHNANKTVIDGAKIYTGTISADKLTTGGNPNIMRRGYDGFEQIAPGPIAFNKNTTVTSTEISSDYGLDGTKSLKVVTGATNTDGYVYMGGSSTDAYVPLMAGKSYIYSFYAYNPSGTAATVQGYVACNDTAKTFFQTDTYYKMGIKTVAGAASITSADGWVRFVKKFTPLTGTTGCCPRVDVDTASATVYFDGFQIEEVPASSTEPSVFAPAGTTIIYGGNITAETVTTTQLAAGAVTADILSVTAKNKVNNFSTTESLSNWSVNAALSLAQVPDTTPTGFRNGQKAAKLTNNNDIQIYGDWFEVDSTKTYKVSMSIYSVNANNSGSVYFGVNASTNKSDNVVMTTFNPTSRVWGTESNNCYFWSQTKANTTSTAGNREGWVDIEAYILGENVNASEAPVPSTGTVATGYVRMKPNTKYLRLRFLNFNTAPTYGDGTTTTSYYYSPTVTEVGTGVIHGDTILANTIKTAHLQANSITSNLINAGAVTATKMNVKGLTVSNGAKNTLVIDASGNVTIDGNVRIGSGNTYENGYDPTLISVGVNNLINNSTFNKLKNGSLVDWNTVHAKWNVLENPDADKPLSNILTASATGNASNVIYSAHSNYFTASAGDTFTVSLDIKVTNFTAWDVKAPFIIELMDKDGVRSQYKDVYNTNLGLTAMNNGQWYRGSWTFTVGNTSDLNMINSNVITQGRVRLTLFKNGEIFIREVKVEKGNKPTEWSASLADTYGDIKDLQGRVATAEIAILDGNITSTVTNSIDFKNIMDAKANASALSNYTTNAALDTAMSDMNKNIKDAIDKIDFTPFVQKSELDQTATSITGKFQASGGVNLVRNSVGFAGLDFWGGLSGTIYSVQTSELADIGYGSGFSNGAGQSGLVEQEISVTAGFPHILSFYMKKDVDNATNGWAGLDVYENGVKLTFLGKGSGGGTTSGYERFTYSWIPKFGKAKIRITLGNNAIATITAIMVNIGDVPLQWTMAQGEIYNTNVRMDMNGLKVSKFEDQKETKFTVMTPDKFGGYYDVNGDGVIDQTDGSVDEVFKMDEDKFVMKRAIVKQEVSMGSVKILSIETATNKGWAFVPSL